MRTTETVDPLLMGMKAAAKFLGVSRTTLWRMVNDGQLKKLRSYPAVFDFDVPTSKQLPTEINPSNSSEFWWHFFHLEAKITLKLVGGFVGFCARNFRVFQSVPIFAWKRKKPIKIALKPMI
jgi:hypothetical protein